MILYNGFGHGAYEPKSMLAVMQSNLDWFDYYIWKQPIPKDSPLWGTSELETGSLCAQAHKLLASLLRVLGAGLARRPRG